MKLKFAGLIDLSNLMKLKKIFHFNHDFKIFYYYFCTHYHVKSK